MERKGQRAKKARAWGGKKEAGEKKRYNVIDDEKCHLRHCQFHHCSQFP